MNSTITPTTQANPSLESNKAYGYLMKHSRTNRFKIGLSNCPSARAEQLIEDQMIRRTQSIQVAFPSRKRASEVERSLHKALGDYRFIFESSCRHEGDTEWFAMDGWHVAVELIKRIPIGRDELSKLESLLGDSYLDYSSGAVDSLQGFENDHNRKVFENLRRMDNVVSIFLSLSAWCHQLQIKVSLEALKLPCSSKQPMISYILKIASLRQTWSVAELRLRYKLLNIDLYKFHTYATRGIHTEVSFVKRIQALPVGVDLICMHLCSPAGLKSLPGGKGIHVRWKTILQNLAALTAQGRSNIYDGH